MQLNPNTVGLSAVITTIAALGTHAVANALDSSKSSSERGWMGVAAGAMALSALAPGSELLKTGGKAAPLALTGALALGVTGTILLRQD